MNVFKLAMNLISTINRNKLVIIRTKSSVFNKTTGVYETMTSELLAEAQVQTNPQNIQDKGDTATDTFEQYDLWFVNLTPSVINSLINVELQNTEIIYNGKTISLTEREDYSYNGWIFCKGVVRAIDK